MLYKTFMIGRLTRDAEMRYLPDGKAVTNFTIAVDTGWGDRASTEYPRIAVWGKAAEALNQYLTKGTLVHIEAGEPKVEVFAKKDGSTGVAVQYTGFNVRLLGGGTRQSDGAETDNAVDAEDTYFEEDYDEDEIPF